MSHLKFFLSYKKHKNWEGVAPNLGHPSESLWKDEQYWQSFTQTHEEKVRTQINKIRNVREVTTDTMTIKIIIRKYYEQLYANWLKHLYRMDKFLEKYHITKLNKKLGNLNRLITINEIEAVIKKKKTLPRQLLAKMEA